MKLFKFLVVLLTILVIAATSCHSQRLVVTKDKSGKYVNTIQSDSLILDTPIAIYEDSKGVEYPIYKSKANRTYIVRISKNTNKKYKQYLKISN